MDNRTKLFDYNTPALSRCAYPAPYPKIQVVRPNLYYARLLLEDYAGYESELTAITQYMYHHFTLESEYKDVAELLSCIAIVEMHHLEMLAETILLLGGDPRYRTIRRNCRRTNWNSAFVFYGTELCEKLEADIESEKTAIKNYRRHQEMIDDPFVKEILERIILDEMHHIQLFEGMLKKYCR